MITRRQFLRGSFSAPEPVTPGRCLARINGACLVFTGVVCRGCGDACGEAAIRFTPRPGNAAALPQVLEDRCTGCGECVDVCPASAVTMAGDRPPNNS